MKPENLLLDETKSIKIIDFGFGNTFIENGYLDTFCGSPFYAAPEMILGKKYEGPEVDMWSLGVILFALLCGHLPFDDANMKELYKKIASGTYTIPDYLMPDARHLISRLITVDPHKRATLAEVLQHRWVNDGYTHPPCNYMNIRPVIREERYLDQDIIKRLSHFGYKKEDVVKAFTEANPEKPHPIRSTYWLLYEMLQREEKKAREKRALHHRHHQQQAISSSSSSTNNLSSQKQSKISSPSFSKNKYNMNSQKKDTENMNASVTTSTTLNTAIGSSNNVDSKPPSSHNYQYDISSEKKKANQPTYNYTTNDKYSKLYPDQCSKYTPQNNTALIPPLDDKYNRQYMDYNMEKKYVSQSTIQDIKSDSNQFTFQKPTIITNTNRIQRIMSNNVSPTSIGGGITSNSYNNINSESNKLSLGSPLSNSMPYQINNIRQNRIDTKFDINMINEDQPESASCVLEQSQYQKNGIYDYGITNSKLNVYNTCNNNTNTALENINNNINVAIQKGENPNEYEDRFRRHSLPTFSSYNNNTITNNNNESNSRKNSITSKAKEEIRAVSGWFINVSATSTKTIQEIIYEITKVLQQNNIPHYYDGNSTIECECLNVSDLLDSMDNSSPNPADIDIMKIQNNMTDPNNENSIDYINKKNKNSLRFQIEICHIPRMGAYGLHFKRLFGGVWNYKKICTKLLSQMDI